MLDLTRVYVRHLFHVQGTVLSNSEVVHVCGIVRFSMCAVLTYTRRVKVVRVSLTLRLVGGSRLILEIRSVMLTMIQFRANDRLAYVYGFTYAYTAFLHDRSGRANRHLYAMCENN